MSISDFYTHEVVVYSLTHVEDSYGGETSTWGISIASYDCRIFKPSEEGMIADIGQFEGIPYKVIGESGSINIGDKLVDDSNEYLVKRVYPVYNTTAINHLELVVDKIK